MSQRTAAVIVVAALLLSCDGETRPECLDKLEERIQAILDDRMDTELDADGVGLEFQGLSRAYDCTESEALCQRNPPDTQAAYEGALLSVVKCTEEVPR